MVDPVVSNYKLVLDLDVACAFNYSLEEMKAMYKNAGIDLNPNIFESGFPAVHRALYCMKLDVLKFLLEKGADIDSLENHEGCTLLDLIHRRYQSGQIDKNELVEIYRIVRSKVGAHVTAKFNRQVLLHDIYDILCSGEQGDIVILSSEECKKYREVVHDVISTFKVKVDADVASALGFSASEIMDIYGNDKIDGNALFTGYPAAQYAIKQGRFELLDFLIKSCRADIDVTKDKRGRNLVAFLFNCRNELTKEQLFDMYKCLCANLPYTKVNIFERTLFLDAFYTNLLSASNAVNDITYVLPKEKVLELRALIPSEIKDPPHIEPDVAHLMGYSQEAVLDMVARGANVLSVVTGFPILSRYIYSGNYDAVSRIIELSEFRCNVLFICDKMLKLPLAYVKKEGNTVIYFSCI